MVEASELTLARMLPIWWAVFWRWSIVGGIIGGVAGGVVGAVMAAIGLATYITPVAFVLGLVLTVPIGLWAVHSALTRRYKGFEITIQTTAAATFS